MHLLIPFAGTVNDAGLAAQAALKLPRLQALLGLCRETERDCGDEASLSPPHERAAAAALGLGGADGRIPWAAHLAAADGLDTGDTPAGLLTPTHWQVGSGQVDLLDPDLLELDAATSRAVFDVVRPLFESEGIALRWGAPLRWYALHESLADLPTASIDRAIGRNIETWLPPRGQARLLRRLQNEVQMLLYTHPFNAERELPVNSFWISGCGRRRPAPGTPASADTGLRAAALAGDWQAWALAWQRLDDGAVDGALAAAQRGEPVELTLAGERCWVRYQAQPVGLLRRLERRWRPVSVPAVLAAL